MRKSKPLSILGKAFPDLAGKHSMLAQQHSLGKARTHRVRVLANCPSSAASRTPMDASKRIEDADLLLSTSNALASAAKREYESAAHSASPIAKVSRTAGGATHFTLPVMANPTASAMNAVQAAFMAAPIASSVVSGPAAVTGSAATAPIYCAVLQQPAPPAPVPKPRGPAPAGYTWDSVRGVWVDAFGKVREPKRSAAHPRPVVSLASVPASASVPRSYANATSGGPVIADAFVSSSSTAFPVMMAPGLMPGQYEVPTSMMAQPVDVGQIASSQSGQLVEATAQVVSTSGPMPTAQAVQASQVMPQSGQVVNPWGVQGMWPISYPGMTMQWMPPTSAGTCAVTTSAGTSAGTSADSPRDTGTPVRVVCRGCGLVRLDVEGRRWVHNHRQGKGNKQFVCNRVLCDCKKGTICPNKGQPHDPGMQPVEQLICPPVGCSSSQQEDLTYGSLSAIERGIHKHGVQSCADSTSSADAIVDSAGDYPSTMTTVLPEPLGAQTHVVAALPMGQPTEDEQESLPMAEAVPAYERTIVAPPTKRNVQEASVAAAMAAAATAAAAAVVARAEAVTATPQESVEA